MSFEVSSLAHGDALADRRTQQYTDLMLYHQLLYYGSLFDGAKALDACKNTPRYG